MKYRKKPVVIDAIQWDGKNLLKVYRFVHGEDSVKLNCRISEDKWDDYERTINKEGFKIKTLEGIMTANINDYIIKGVSGEFYPCKPDIFEKTYEKLEHEIHR